MSQRRVQFCIAINAQAGKAPEWVELLPAPDANGKVVGRDGRTWLWDDTARVTVLNAFTSEHVDLPIDWNHATQLSALKDGGDAPAAGWVSAIEVREGALWGKVEWTPRGQEQVGNREYRYLSPVFNFAQSTGRIEKMVTAALTNLPNLHLTALNHEDQTMNRSLLLLAALTSALGLTSAAAAVATDDEIAQGINTLKKKADDSVTALNSQVPSLDRYVPRADYEALNTRLAEAQNSLQARNQADFKLQVDGAIADALKAGKITPATEPHHRATCTDAAALQRFKDFVAVAPAVGNDTNLGERRPEDKATALNAEEQKVCSLMGIEPKDFAAIRALG